MNANKLSPVRGLRDFQTLRIPTRRPALHLKFRGTPSVRQASTAVETGSSIVSRLRNLFLGTTFILGSSLIYLYITDTRASVHRWVVIPALRLVFPDPEDAHHAGNISLKALYSFGLHPRERGDPDKVGDLEVEVFGHTLVNPIGTSAGIDKKAEIPDPLFAIGPAIIEVGGATPQPQGGNPKPRVFRVPSQNAMINRYGLNSEGADRVATRLRQRVREFARNIGLGHDAVAEQHVLNGHAGVPPGSLMPGRLLAINIAKNKTTPEGDLEAVKGDYVYCVDRLGPYADILVVNVSSPNTPGLRSLQQTEPLTKLLSGVVEAAKKVPRRNKPAVMVKVSPDEDSDEQIAGVCQAVWESGVDGVIVGNTTNQRPAPLHSGHVWSPEEEEALKETGGYSGPQLFERTVALVGKYRQLLNEKPPPSEKKAADTETKGSSTAMSLEDKLREVEASIEIDKAALKPMEGKSPSASTLKKIESSIDSGKIAFEDQSDKLKSDKEPLLRLPDKGESRLRALAAAIEQLPAQEDPSEKPKVIFATGGITNGKQALDVLNAGASVAMVYTTLVYNGVGAISKIKDEMRAEKSKSVKGGS